jgi:hypothetical protein
VHQHERGGHSGDRRRAVARSGNLKESYLRPARGNEGNARLGGGSLADEDSSAL